MRRMPFYRPFIFAFSHPGRIRTHKDFKRIVTARPLRVAITVGHITIYLIILTLLSVFRPSMSSNSISHGYNCLRFRRSLLDLEDDPVDNKNNPNPHRNNSHYLLPFPHQKRNLPSSDYTDCISEMSHRIVSFLRRCDILSSGSSVYDHMYLQPPTPDTSIIHTL